jgi:hypothetical protein
MAAGPSGLVLAYAQDCAKRYFALACAQDCTKGYYALAYAQDCAKRYFVSRHPGAKRRK